MTSDEIMRVKNGEASFDAFAKATMRYWRRAAADLLGRWDHPAAVDEDDLVQEMLLAVWRAIQQVDPERGDPRRRIVFSAAKSARRWLHRQRGAHGFARCRPGSNPDARFPVAAPAAVDRAAGPESPQEIAAAVMDAMALAQTEQDREILESFLRRGEVARVAAERCSGRRGNRVPVSEAKIEREVVRGALRRISERAAMVG